MEGDEYPPHPKAVFLEQGFTGYPETLTPREEKLLASAKEQVPPREARALRFRGEQLDAMYCRFLRARKFDVQAACSMMRTAMDWRRRFGVDKLRCMTAEEVLGFSEAVIHQYFPQFLLGFDHRGRPITLRLGGKLDVKGLLRHVDIETFVRYYVWQHERCIEMMSDVTVLTGHSNFRFCAIINMDGFGWSSFSSEVREVTQRLSAIMSDYYPETMGTGFLINSPWVFTAIWRIASALLDEVTKSRTRILGGSFHKEVFHEVPREIVPTALGGARRGLNLDPSKWDETTFPYLIERLSTGKDLIASASPEAVERMLRCRHEGSMAAAEAAGVPWRGPRPGELPMPSNGVERPLSVPHGPSNDRGERGGGCEAGAAHPAFAGEPSGCPPLQPAGEAGQGEQGPDGGLAKGPAPRQSHLQGEEGGGGQPQALGQPKRGTQPEAFPTVDPCDAAAAGGGASGSGVAATESDVGSQSSRVSGSDAGPEHRWEQAPEVSPVTSSRHERGSETEAAPAASDEGHWRGEGDAGHRRVHSSTSRSRQGSDRQLGGVGEADTEDRTGRSHRHRGRHRDGGSKHAASGHRGESSPPGDRGRWEKEQRREFRRRFRNPGLVRLAPGVYGRSSKVDIPPQGEHHRTVLVRTGQVLEWSFSTKPYDIGFSVMLNGAVKRRHRRLPSHKVKQGGCLPVTESGTCVLVWSNRFSWLTGKQLFFTLRCIDASAVAAHASESTCRALREAAQEEGEEAAAARAIAAAAGATTEGEQPAAAVPPGRSCSAQ